MGLTWYSKLYKGRKFHEDPAVIASQVAQGTYTGSSYVIMLSVNGKDQLDIRHTRDLCRSYLRSRDIFAVGAASDRREAIGLLRKMALDCVRETGDADLRSYFLAAAGREPFRSEDKKEAER